MAPGKCGGSLRTFSICAVAAAGISRCAWSKSTWEKSWRPPLTAWNRSVTNLLVNAAKYTQFGGRIRLTAEVFGDDLVLRVRDNGIGIAPDLLPHVFEPYRRGFVLPPHDGLGLGLALVKSLVDLHGGTVTACSDGPGKGSEFVVRLPREYRPTSSLTADSANANHDRPMCSKTID
jgi:glucose-6-phosphate-specific signal transduction histidine kinase